MIAAVGFVGWSIEQAMFPRATRAVLAFLFLLLIVLEYLLIKTMLRKSIASHYRTRFADDRRRLKPASIVPNSARRNWPSCPKASGNAEHARSFCIWWHAVMRIDDWKCLTASTSSKAAVGVHPDPQHRVRRRATTSAEFFERAAAARGRGNDRPSAALREHLAAHHANCPSAIELHGSTGDRCPECSVRWATR